MVYNWRNADFIRVNMFHDKKIPYEEHCQWFDNTLKNKSAYYRIFCYQKKPLGIVSFKESDSEKKTYYWGFYIGETDAPKGAGTWMGRLALDDAFQYLGAKTVIGEALSFNQKSISFHKRLGFEKDIDYKASLSRNGQHIDIIRFTLEKDNWDKQKETLNLHFT